MMAMMTTQELKEFLDNKENFRPKGTFSQLFGSQLTPQQTAFLAAFSVLGQVQKSSKAVGISFSTHNLWLREAKKDGPYKKGFEIAQKIAQQSLEDEAVYRATEGLRKYKFDKDGKPILHPETGQPYYEDVRSDLLLIFLLKAADPQKFRENSSVQVTGANGQPIEVSSTVRVCEDSDWYGNAHQLNKLNSVAPTCIAAPGASAD
jgi:hypothetical protein